MRRFATIAIVLGLAGGLLGMFAFNDLSGRAGAAAGQQREDQITIFAVIEASAMDVGEPSGGWRTVFNYPNVAVDSTDYPTGAVFRLETVSKGGSCLRLFNRTDNVPMPASEVCDGREFSMGDTQQRQRSDPSQLTGGEHELYLQCSEPCTAGWLAARLVVEWNEPVAVGGLGELPPMAGIGGSPSHNYAVAATLALVAVVAFAAGGWYARRRWLR